MKLEKYVCLAKRVLHDLCTQYQWLLDLFVCSIITISLADVGFLLSCGSLTSCNSIKSTAPIE